LAVTVVSLAASAPAAADTDQYGNRLEFLDAQFQPVPCNPSYARLRVSSVSLGGRGGGLALFMNAVAWADYFGIPVFVSTPFRAGTEDLPYALENGATWPVPSPAEMLPGQYTLHVLLQGNGEALSLYSFPLYFVFTTVTDTATIAPGLNTDCSPIAASTSASAARVSTHEPSWRVLARRVRALRRDADTWFGRSNSESRTSHPKVRFCGHTICLQLRPGAAWKRLTER
jgi:hypothetical protein